MEDYNDSFIENEITKIPTLLLFKNNNVENKLEGLVSTEKILQVIETL